SYRWRIRPGRSAIALRRQSTVRAQPSDSCTVHLAGKGDVAVDFGVRAAWVGDHLAEGACPRPHALGDLPQITLRRARCAVSGHYSCGVFWLCAWSVLFEPILRRADPQKTFSQASILN